MTRFVIDTVLDVDAPADVVWEVITDLSRYGEWNPFCVSCVSTLKPGEPIAMSVALTEKPQKVVEWIVSCTPKTGFVYRMKPMPLGALSSLRSHEIGAAGAQRSRYTSHFHLEGWLKPLVLALFRPNLERGFAGMSAGIKARAEQLWRERQERKAS